MLISPNSQNRQATSEQIGQAPLRREDKRLVTGAGRFVADVILDDPLHICFVRSPVATGTISSCTTTDALSHPDVAAVFTGKDVAHLGALSVNPVLGPTGDQIYQILAADQVSATGQAVAAVLANTERAARDTAEMVLLEVDETASFERANPAFARQWREGDTQRAFREADHVVEAEVHHPRLAPSPMENRAIAVQYDGHADTATVWLSSQTPHRARKELADILAVDIDRIRVVAPDVGGAFGLKASLYPEEVFAVWVAFELRRSTRWIASRSEDMLAASHGRGIVTRGRLALSKDGEFLGLQASATAPVGNWLTNSAAIPAWNAGRILPGPYDIASLDLHTQGVWTNTAPVGIYRGAGRPEAAMLMERLVEESARKLDIDSMELRRKNLLPPEQLPKARKSGVVLDSGDYPAALAMLMGFSDYDHLRQEQKRRRSDGEFVGIGAAFFVEPCGTGWESAAVRINPDGSVIVKTGGSSQGHGRETVLAQIAADTLGCDPERITVGHGDTESCPDGIGALASRSTAIGGSAVVQAATNALERAGGSLMPQEPVEARVKYSADGEAWGYGCYLALVSIDADTGALTIEKLFCLDDAGTIVHPDLVKGQLRGGIAQGIGEAALERLVYDDAGQLITGSLMDYALPRAADVPEIAFAQMETPSPMNLLGAKGVGEAGTIGAPAAICNAVADALAPIGAVPPPMPMTSNAIWQAIRSAADQPNGNED